ncbi:hypothetical protein GGI12_001015 [Dipsacomyces acuminosporus]|nr:hypothetical protein GGI12_001015 [Dipsacomyces acuminosporus]
MYSSAINSTRRLAGSLFAKRGVSTVSAGSKGTKAKFSVRRYSESNKRSPQLASSSTQSQQQQQKQESSDEISKSQVVAPIEGGNNRNRVPKFTMPRTEFMMADLFARHRQLVGTPDAGDLSASVDVGTNPRPSFKTLSELSMSKGLTTEEADVPHMSLKQIYAAPASVYMQVTPDAMIPEAMRLGPLAEPLLGQDPFRDGISSLQLGKGEDMKEFVEEFFDTILANAQNAPSSGAWSLRKERREARAYVSRWQENEMVDPVDRINGLVEDGEAETPVEYQMTSVLRKRKTKMNKHKHRKLRKRTRALRKRLGK